MFAPEPWAAAFINTLRSSAGEEASSAAGEASFAAGETPFAAAAEGLEALRALVPVIRRIKGAVAGSVSARRLAGMIRAASIQTGTDTGVMAAVTGLLVLLIKRNCFDRIDRVNGAIEKLLDQKRGILTVTAESALPLDGETREALKKRLAARTGAGEVRLLTRIVPELIGGCRLRVGSDVIDASLRFQLQKMAGDLSLPGGGF
jgi:F-type H+-transporting ATPase subunit delta